MPPSFCVTVTLMDSLKGDFYRWSSQTMTHQKSSDLNLFDQLSLVWFFLLLKNKSSGWCLLELEVFASSNQKIKIHTIETKHHILKCPYFWLWHTRGWFDCRFWNDHQGCTKLPTQLLFYIWLSVKWTCINPAFCLCTLFITLRGLSLMFNI